MASHPSPFYRNRQSTKALDPNGPTAKFLYTILKQLDLKNIDWNEVASGLDITNGHAARMRWSRFRAQIEGLDNSYARQSGKKRDGEKKRKREKQGDDASKKEINDQKKIKAELVADPREVTTMQMNLYGSMGIPPAVKKEHTERPSTINGIRIHHPRVTTVEASQSVPKAPMIKQDPFARNSTTVFANKTALKSIASSAPAAPTYHTNAFESDLQWSQQILDPNQFYQYTPAANTWSYQPVSSNYGHGYQYSNIPTGQSGQQRLLYGHPQSRIPTQQPAYYLYNGINSTLSTTAPSLHNIAMLQPEVTAPAEGQNIAPEFPSSAEYSPLQNNDQSQSTADICELATEASYPWPYSEASLENFSREVGEGRHIENGELSLIDITGVDAEHVIEPDINMHQSLPPMSNESGAVETRKSMRDETSTLNEPVQQEKNSAILKIPAPASSACSHSSAPNPVKSEPEL